MTDTTLFLVRVWRQLTAFRASVRRVDDEDAHLFKSADDMARYLEGITSKESQDHASAGDSNCREEPQ